jgi:hypothetical protein
MPFITITEIGCGGRADTVPSTWPTISTRSMMGNDKADEKE